MLSTTEHSCVKGNKYYTVTWVCTPLNLQAYWSTLEKATRFNARLYCYLYLCKSQQYYPDHIGQTGNVGGPSSLFLHNLTGKSQGTAKCTTRAFIIRPGRQELGCCTLMMLNSSVSPVVPGQPRALKATVCIELMVSLKPNHCISIANNRTNPFVQLWGYHQWHPSTSLLMTVTVQCEGNSLICSPECGWHHEANSVRAAAITSHHTHLMQRTWLKH